jgi:hypothetical protein
VTGRASEAQLDALHGFLSEVLTDELRVAREEARELAPGEDGRFPEGRPRTPINPQLLDKVMKFLATNGVDTPKQSPRKDALADELRDLDLDQEAVRLSH